MAPRLRFDLRMVGAAGGVVLIGSVDEMNRTSESLHEATHFESAGGFSGMINV